MDLMVIKNAKEYITQVQAYSPELPPQDLLDYMATVKSLKAFGDDVYPWDNNDNFRNEVAVELYKCFLPEDCLFIRYLLGEMSKSRAWCYGGAVIVLAAFMLFEIGNVEDVFSIYNAKFGGNMDSAIAIDQHLLFGAGVDNTMEYLKGVGTPEAQEILKYIEESYLPYHDRVPDNYQNSMKEYYQDILKPDWQYDPTNPPLY